MSLDADVAEVVRKVVREELDRALARLSLGGPDAPLGYEKAAEYLGCSTSTIAGWKKSGALPFTGKGTLTRFKRSDLLACLERMSAPAVAEAPAAVAERIFNTPKRKAG